MICLPKNSRDKRTQHLDTPRQAGDSEAAKRNHARRDENTDHQRTCSERIRSPHWGRTDGILFRWVWLPSRLLTELCRFRGCPGELGTGSSSTKVEKGIQGGVGPSAGPGSHVAIVSANFCLLGLFYRLPRSPGAAVSTPPSALRFQSRLVDCTRSWGER